MSIKIHLFGAFYVTLDDQPVTEFRSDKTRALLAYLAVEGQTPLRRTSLAELLWAGYAPESARNSLRMSLTNLNRLFTPGNLLHTTYQTVHFVGQPPKVWSDVQLLEALYQRDSASFEADDWRQVATLPQGDFLVGFEAIDSQPFQDWLLQKRARYAQQLAELQRRLLGSAAIRPVSSPHNLPRSLTPLVGRLTEIATLTRFVQDPHYPLITGEGGIGKTRLVLRVAQEILDSPPTVSEKPLFPDGLWFVALAALVPGDDVAEQLAAAMGAVLGVSFRGQLTLSEQLVGWLRFRSLMLILDNMEHLLAGKELLLRLLQAAPGVKLVVTSRQRLNMQTATHFPVRELATPAQEDATTLAVEQLLAYPSVQLFVERGQRARPNFRLQAANQAAVVRICHLVGGLPLAIELAATLLEIHSCQSVADLLAQDYTLLRSDQVDLPAHQRSVQAVLDASWQLLTLAEAQLLAQCALLRADFTVEAASAITAATPAQLRGLVDKSLVRQSMQPVARFSLHELVRQYAERQLASWPSLYEQAAERHAAYYLALLQRLGATLGQQAETLQQMRLEWDNIRAAWLWSANHGKVALLDQGLEGLVRFCRLTGLYGEALQGLQSATGAIGHRATTSAKLTEPEVLRQSLFLIYEAEFCRRQGHLDESEKIAQAALAKANQAARPEAQGLAYQELAQLAHMHGNYTQMRVWAEQAWEQARRAQLPRLEAECLSNLGIASVFLGDLAPAIGHFQAALHCLLRTPDRSLEARLTSNLGSAYLQRHDYMLARHYLTHALALARARNDQPTAAVRSLFLGDLWVALGDYAQAQASYEAAWQIIQLTRDPYWEGWLHASWGRLLHLRGDLATAYRECLAALQIAHQTRMHLTEHRTLTFLGQILAKLGGVDEARDFFQRAIALAQQSGLIIPIADPLAGLAELLLAQHDQAGALYLVEKTLSQLARYGLAAAEEPFQVYWGCYCVLRVEEKPRAAALLQQAEGLLQAQAAKIDNPALRQTYLTQVAVNRAILAEAQVIRTSALLVKETHL